MIIEIVCKVHFFRFESKIELNENEKVQYVLILEVIQ